MIKQGDNELTAKITCLNERNPNADAFHLMSASAAPLNSSPPLSKWHTVNVTGVAGAPSVSQALPPASSTEGLVEEEDNDESDEEELASSEVPEGPKGVSESGRRRTRWRRETKHLVGGHR